MKTARLVKHARYYWLLLAESRLTRRVFGAMVERIAALSVGTGYKRRRASEITGGGEACMEVAEKVRLADF